MKSIVVRTLPCSYQWSGAGSLNLPLGRTAGKKVQPTKYWAGDDEVLLANLTAAAWREDPRPLDHPSYSDRRSEGFEEHYR